MASFRDDSSEKVTNVRWNIGGGQIL
jgi:hypothetical protein